MVIQLVDGFGSAQCDYVGHIGTLTLTLVGGSAPVDIRIGCRVETFLHDGESLALESFDYDVDAPLITVHAGSVSGAISLGW